MLPRIAICTLCSGYAATVDETL